MQVQPYITPLKQFDVFRFPYGYNLQTIHVIFFKDLRVNRTLSFSKRSPQFRSILSIFEISDLKISEKNFRDFRVFDLAVNFIFNSPSKQSIQICSFSILYYLDVTIASFFKESLSLKIALRVSKFLNLKQFSFLQSCSNLLKELLLPVRCQYNY